MLAKATLKVALKHNPRHTLKNLKNIKNQRKPVPAPGCSAPCLPPLPRREPIPFPLLLLVPLCPSRTRTETSLSTTSTMSLTTVSCSGVIGHRQDQTGPRSKTNFRKNKKRRKLT
uniref:(northern house mosquito) hypothetical protein n=1 Tax=Culex pipiens TaxID=7175 RepID=A0A8D8BRG6_CULPI